MGFYTLEAPIYIYDWQCQKIIKTIITLLRTGILYLLRAENIHKKATLEI